MKIPKTFLPEKNLEEKTKDLLETKPLQKTEEEKYCLLGDNDYKKISHSLYDYINTKTTGWKGIIYISDHSEKNRYELVKDMLNNITGKLSVTYNLRLLDFFGKPVDKDLFNRLYQAILWEKLDESSIGIVYTSDHMTDGLAEDVTKWQMLMHGASICSLSEPDE